jgi:hypothetical protein
VDQPGGGEPSVGFRKDPLGRVHLKGLITKVAPANGDSLFTLPVGWRPPAGAGNLRWLVPYSSSTIGVYINQTTGDLRLWYGAQANLNIDLSVIGFDTETVTAMPTGPQGPKGDTGGNATVPIDPWHVVGATGEPGFTNGWGAVATENAPAFYKDPLGIVRLRGTIGGGTQGLAAFTLPVGYRPATPPGGRLRGVSINNQGTAAWAQVNINGDGQVIGWGDSNQYISLDQLSFDSGTVTAMPTGPKGDTGATGATGGNATVPMDPWHAVGAAGEPAFLNSWTNYGSGYTTLAFRKNPLGKVQLRGMLRSAGATAGLNIFTLPTGYRPTARALLDAIAENVQARVDVNTDGSVMMMMTAATGTYLSLDGIEFDTDSIAAMPTGPQGPPGATGGNATVPMDAWHTVGAAGEPAFAAGWSNLDGAGPNQRALRFTKDPLGRVLLTGIVKGANSTVIFTLPAGYRPVRLNQIIDANASGGNAQVVVSSNGDVTATTLTGNVATYVSLDNIIFDTETVTAMPTGPTGPQGPGSARMWRGADTGTIRSTQAVSFNEISSALRITPAPSLGTLIELSLSGQWEHNTAGAYFAVQVWDFTTGALIPTSNLYWVLRAVTVGANVSFHVSTVVAASLVSGHILSPYWSTGSGQCTARNDVTPMNFTAKEYV